MKKLVSVTIILLLVSVSIGCSKVKVDSELMDAIEAAASRCKLDMRYAFVKDCEEVKKLSELTKKKIPGALATVSVALNDKDEKVRVVACKLMYREIKDNMSKINKQPKLITGAIVDNLINGMANLKKYVAMYAAASTTHVAMMNGAGSKLYAMLDAHPEDVVRTEAYTNVMTYGRMKAFDKIKDLVKSSNKNIVYAALNAPRGMYKKTNEEKKTLGDWALPMLDNEDPKIVFRAAALLNQCNGKYIDAVLDKCEKLAAKGELKPPISYALTNYTFSCKGFFGSKPTGTKEQCAKLEKLKKKIKK